MKKIEAVILPERFPAISAALQEAEKNGMTVSEVRGHACLEVWNTNAKDQQGVFCRPLH